MAATGARPAMRPISGTPAEGRTSLFWSEGGKVRFPVPRCRSSASRRRAGVHAEPTPGAAANLLIYLTPDRQPVIGGGIYLEADRRMRGVGCGAGSLINSAGSTSRTVASFAMISRPG